MWSVLLREFLQYLPRQDSHLHSEDGKIDQARGSEFILVMEVSGCFYAKKISFLLSVTFMLVFADYQVKYDVPNGSTPISHNEVAASPGSGSTVAITGLPSYIFAEKLVPVLVELFLQAPAVEKHIIYPEIIQSLGR